MDCRDVRDRLSPFLDDELDPMASRDVAAHLETCPDCAAELARLEGVRTILRREIAYAPAPPALRDRVRREVRGAFRTSSRPVRPAFSWWLRSAGAAAAFAAVVVLLALPLAGRRDDATREAIADHVRSLMANHLTDVVSTDQHTVKPWFAGKLDFSPPVTDFASEGFPLVGGRLDVLDGRPVAALVYRRRQHVINALVRPVSRDAGIRTDSRDGWHVVSFARGGMGWWVVSDLNAAELADFARRVESASH